MTSVRDSREIGGQDALDLRVGGTEPARPGLRLLGLFRSRAAFGLRPIAAPAIVFIPVGLLLGPNVLNALSIDVLAHLETGVSMGLAALGVFVGLALDLRTRDDHRMLAAASAEAAVTIAFTAAAMLLLLTSWNLPLDASPIVVALTLGICASASSAGAAELLNDPVHRIATRIADLDDVLPIVIGGVVIAAVTRPAIGAAVLMAGSTCLIGLAVGLAGWLLFERAGDGAERGVFVLGAVALLGGSAAYLSLSPLLAGTIAGLFWTHSPGHADQIIRDDLQKIQRPLIVLLLLAAGASLHGSVAAIWLFGPFVIFRLGGKLAGGWTGAQVVSIAPADLGAYLIPPGVVGIAFALNFQQVSGTPTAAAVVTATAAGSLVCEVLGLLTLREPDVR